MDGKDLTTIEYDAGKVDEPHKLTRIVKLNQNTRTPNFKIEAVGSAASDVSFNVTMNGNLYFRENRLLSISADTSLLDTGKLLGGGIKDTFSSFFKSEDMMIQSINNGLVLRRDYAFVTRVRDMNNNEYLIPQRIDYKKGLKIGDEILVRIKFQAQDKFLAFFNRLCLSSGIQSTLPGIKTSREFSRLLTGLDHRVLFSMQDLIRLTQIISLSESDSPAIESVKQTMTFKDRTILYQALLRTMTDGTGSQQTPHQTHACANPWGKTSTVADGTNRLNHYGIFIGGCQENGIIVVQKNAIGRAAAKSAIVILNDWSKSSIKPSACVSIDIIFTPADI